MRQGAATMAVGGLKAHAGVLQAGLHLFNSSPRTLLTQPVQVRPDFIGMHFHRWPSGTPVSPAPTYGFGATRSHDYAGLPHGIFWSSIHQGPNTFDWSAMDLWVNTHAAQGRTLLYTVYGTPDWVTSAPQLKDPYGRPGGSSPPRALQPLHDFITALVKRYNAQQTRIQFLEIWNEPHFEQVNAQFWWGTAEQLATIGRTIYQAAKAVDPKIRVLTPGFIAGATVPLTGDFRLAGMPSETARTGSLYQYLTASDGAGGTGAHWCDGVGFHSYNPHFGSPTQGLEKEVPLLKRLLVTMGLNKPLYMTEVGFFPTSDFAHSSVADKATTLQRLAVTVAALGVQTMYFYAHDDEYIGNPSKNPPLAEAIGLLNQRLPGKTLQQVTIQPDGAYLVSTSAGDFTC